MKLKRNVGTLLLAIWLIVSGLDTLLPSLFAIIPYLNVLMAILAIAAGVLLLIGK